MDLVQKLSSLSMGSPRGSGDRASEHTVRRSSGYIPYHVKGLAHIAIAVPDLHRAAETYRTAFGAHVSLPKAMPDRGVTVVFVHMPNVNIELVHPLGDASPVFKFLQKNPQGGIHHVCLNGMKNTCVLYFLNSCAYFTQVDDVYAAAGYLAGEGGVNTLGSGLPMMGAEGKAILSLNPKDTAGALIELQQGDGGFDTQHHEAVTA